ncbi:hypothetical protein B0A55_05303 [Friedmanniomyces simplex]|uniref:Fe2OG dioxygenase domain-containing protein n=1 Tax=Friedmanniomyces simplex TaxID=329884 RepID=A0A4U0XBW4_9PEZI|nr:hypothetical protein B0A55_05303 [Friedmanniomyces simplex]
MDAYLIPDAPSSMYYISNFITAEDEDFILRSIPPNRWVSLSRRRLQAVPSRLTANNTLLPSPLPAWLEKPVVERLKSLNGIFVGAPHGINHCLINEYLPGQGIMPHEDGGAYHPVVATVSLGGSIVLEVTQKRTADPETPGAVEDQSTRGEKKTWRILQEPRSLLVTCGSAYNDTLHGIAEVVEDVDLSEQTVANWSLLGDKDTIIAHGGRNERPTRTSLTLRDVKKVSGLGSKLFGKTKIGTGR